MAEAAGRVYGGRSEAERRADRRQRLVEAGLELFGTQGWQAASIERLCAAACVATRSFYEEFAGREALMRAVYDAVVAESAAVALHAFAAPDALLEQRIVHAVHAYVEHLTQDPRRARILYRDVPSVSSLAEHRHTVMLSFADVLEEGSAGRPLFPDDPAPRRVAMLALAGGLGEVILDWVSSPEPPPLAPVCEGLARLVTCMLLVPAGVTPSTDA